MEVDEKFGNILLELLSVDIRKHLDENGLHKAAKINNFGFVSIENLPDFSYDPEKGKSNFHQLTGNYKHFLNRPGFYMYYFFNRNSNTYYIGVTKNVRHRLSVYVNDLKRINGPGRDVAILKAIKKHGWINFDYNIIAIFDSEEQMYQKEIEAIKLLKIWKIRNYNESAGGKHCLAPINFGKGLKCLRGAFKTEEEIEKVFKLYHEQKLNLEQIKKEFGLTSATTIGNVLNGTKYTETTKKFIEKYGLIRSSKERAKFKTNIGEKAYNAKFTSNDILNIIQMYFDENKSLTEIAKRFNCARSTIEPIFKGKSWRAVTKDVLLKYKNHSKNILDKKYLEYFNE